ncbi:MAG: excalibur calcium-binding domain-containing protein [Actinobacteria bacterium]|nr:excalibur calcium-binding domain-containing protein [Actinomycetota bacterium]
MKRNLSAAGVKRADKSDSFSGSLYTTSTSLYATALAIVLTTATIFSALTAPAAQAFDLPLTIAPDQLSGYERTLFKHWIDADKDKCDTRKEVLIQEAVSIPKLSSGCVFNGGKWISAYDGLATTDYSTLDIDHMVPLSEAWRSGAWKWSPAQREAFANDLTDPRALVAVTASLNRQKSDQDPSTWLPPIDKCTYVSNWIAIKVRYSLTVDTAEANALTTLVASCNITSITAFSIPAYAITAGITPITLSSPTPTVAPTPTASTEPTTAPTATAKPSAAPKVKKAVKYSSCAKARAAGVTPIIRSKNKTLYALNKALDRDKDGVACE